jgi:hypothetical protein
MTIIGYLLTGLGLYALIGFFVGLVFVIKGIRVIDPVADAAPIRIRLLFLPGCVAIWPIVLQHWRSHAQKRLNMNRELRKRHLRIWSLLGPILIAGVVVALVLRPPSLTKDDVQSSARDLP